MSFRRKQNRSSCCSNQEINMLCLIINSIGYQLFRLQHPRRRVRPHHEAEATLCARKVREGNQENVRRRRGEGQELDLLKKCLLSFAEFSHYTTVRNAIKSGFFVRNVACRNRIWRSMIRGRGAPAGKQPSPSSPAVFALLLFSFLALRE